MYIISFLLKVSKNYDPLNQIGNSKISKTRVPVNKVRYLETRSAEIRGGGVGESLKWGRIPDTPNKDYKDGED